MRLVSKCSEVLVGAMALSILSVSAHASVPFEWDIEIDRLDLGQVLLDNIKAGNRNPVADTPAVHITVPSVSFPGAGFATGPLALSCPGATLDALSNLCSDGTWSLVLDPSWPDVQGTIERISVTEDVAQAAVSGVFDTIRWNARVNSNSAGYSIRLDVPGQDVAGHAFLQTLAEPYSWITAGRMEARVSVNQQESGEPTIMANAKLAGVEFDSPDGLYAGLGVNTEFSVSQGKEAAWTINGALTSGELLLMDFYRDFSERPLRLEAKADWSRDRIDISRFTITDDDAIELVGQAGMPLDNERFEPQVVLREFRLTFPQAYERYIESTASVFSLDGLATSGTVSWQGDWSPGSARSGVLQLQGLRIDDETRGRFSIEGLEGSLTTGADSRLTWETFSFEKMNLGTGEAYLALAPEKVSLTQPLNIGVFGGTLALKALSLSLPREGEPDIQLQASVSDIAMNEMSRAMGWPEFGGTLSGEIPGVRWTGEVIEIDGALDFRVFDGEILLTDLRVERPFGVLPSMAANITATNLDLEELTQTFEFGRIGGRANGYVRDLRMLDWQPVQFDAWFGTPASDDERHGISRQAVQHLTAIGGGSPTAILSGPILKLFNNFSYRRLGLGCELRNNVCRIRGIEEQGEAVLLLEGAGIPKISIQAFNRAVDWPQLLAELTAVSGGENIRIGNQ